MEAKEQASHDEMKAKEKASLPDMKEDNDRAKSVSTKSKAKSAPIPPKIGNDSAMAGNGPVG